MGDGPAGDRLFILTRHAQSTLNLLNVVNGDPRRPAPLSLDGRRQAELLAEQLRHVRIDLAVCTRFDRTRETASVVLEARDTKLVVEPAFDDVDVGSLEGRTVHDYREWKQRHARSDPFPGGESLDDAARRYAGALRGLLTLEETHVLVVCHEIPIRYALEALAGDTELHDGVHVPNAVPFLLSESALLLAADRLDRLVARVG